MNGERTPRAVLAATVRELLPDDAQTEGDADSAAGILLDALTDEDVLALAQIRGFRSIVGTCGNCSHWEIGGGRWTSEQPETFNQCGAIPDLNRHDNGFDEVVAITCDGEVGYVASGLLTTAEFSCPLWKPRRVCMYQGVSQAGVRDACILNPDHEGRHRSNSGMLRENNG